MDNQHAEQTRTLIELIHELQRQVQPRPAPQPEPRVLKWLKSLMPTFLAIFGFGGQITFTVIPTITKDEDVPSDWGAAEVRTFLSLAWMFFTLGFGLACAMALTPAYGGDDLAKNINSKRYEKVVSLLCAMLQLFAALAFFFLSLVVVAYTPVVGWFVFGISCLGVLVAIGAFVIDTWFYSLWRVMLRMPPRESSGP